MIARFLDIGCLHNEKKLAYPLDRVAVVPGEDVIVGRSDECNIKIFPEYLEQAIIKLSEITRRGEEGPASQEQQGIDSYSLEERAEYYGSCSRRHFALCIPRRIIKDLGSRNGTFLARAIRDQHNEPTREYEEPMRLPPHEYVGIKAGDIIYAGRVALLFEEKED
jgi:hypothetical protein